MIYTFFYIFNVSHTEKHKKSKNNQIPEKYQEPVWSLEYGLNLREF